MWEDDGNLFRCLCTALTRDTRAYDHRVDHTR